MNHEYLMSPKHERCSVIYKFKTKPSESICKEHKLNNDKYLHLNCVSYLNNNYDILNKA